ncbi:hypothetical protein M8C21_031792 [Ambrosia artemisiifolia]|uniref:DUF7906 domain-containing protein n=1 Tax=Ambrosia artemisiifolia TaxID=4212 RepID=A0AAD5G7J3_AMBAR|nr:hypothetical protein M8C21_031792 [Ambrosia artemisiifolia]
MALISRILICLCVILSLKPSQSAPPKPYRRDPGHPQWHHSAFQDVKESVRSDVRSMLHSRAEVPFQVPLEVNVVLVGFSGDGGYRYTLDSQKLEEFLRVGFPSHRPSCLETGEPLDIEHHMVFNAFPAAQPELIALEKALKAAMVPAGTAREAEFGREVPAFNVDASVVEPEFQKLYSYLFDYDTMGYNADEADRPMPTAIFIVNFDKVRMDPRNNNTDLDSLMYAKPNDLTEEDIKQQEGGYIYRYHYNGGGASQVWLGSGRFVVIDISAGPCTYGKIETEEGSVSSKTIPRLRDLKLPKSSIAANHLSTTHGNFIGQLAALIGITVQHVIAPDVSIMEKGQNYSIDIEAIETEVKKMEMERSADVLAAGLLEVSQPSLSDKYFLRQNWPDETDGVSDSIIKHKPIWASNPRSRKKKTKRVQKKQGDLHRTYGTRVVPVFVLSLADVDPHLMMDDESLLWTSNDAVIVLQHQSDKIPLSYVSETERRHVVPSQAQRHILAGLASVVGGLSAPYEKASHIHERPVVNWLLAAGCHPFGPFSNASKISQLLQDVALRNTIYARVDSALHRIRETSESVQAFAGEYLKTPLGEPVKGKKNKTTTELWIEKFYKKETNLPEPFPHELVDKLENYLDGLEEQLVDLSSLLYDHRLQDANVNSTEILQSSIFTQQYVEHVLEYEREKMKCCEIKYKSPKQSSQSLNG